MAVIEEETKTEAVTMKDEARSHCDSCGEEIVVNHPLIPFGRHRSRAEGGGFQKWTPVMARVWECRLPFHRLLPLAQPLSITEPGISACIFHSLV